MDWNRVEGNWKEFQGKVKGSVSFNASRSNGDVPEKTRAPVGNATGRMLSLDLRSIKVCQARAKSTE